MKTNTLLHSFGHAILVFIYVSGVASILFNGEAIFGGSKTVWVPLMILMLFVLSTAIVGALVLGRPILLYLEGKKSAAVKFFGCTIGWLFLIILITFALQPWK